MSDRNLHIVVAVEGGCVVGIFVNKMHAALLIDTDIVDWDAIGYDDLQPPEGVTVPDGMFRKIDTEKFTQVY